MEAAPLTSGQILRGRTAQGLRLPQFGQALSGIQHGSFLLVLTRNLGEAIGTRLSAVDKPTDAVL